MANNNFIASANFPACRQPGHWGGYLLGVRQAPPPPTQQELGVALTNHLLDGGQLPQEEEESSNDNENSNIDPQLLQIPNAHFPQPPVATQAMPVLG